MACSDNAVSTTAAWDKYLVFLHPAEVRWRPPSPSVSGALCFREGDLMVRLSTGAKAKQWIFLEACLGVALMMPPEEEDGFCAAACWWNHLQVAPWLVRAAVGRVFSQTLGLLAVSLLLGVALRLGRAGVMVNWEVLRGVGMNSWCWMQELCCRVRDVAVPCAGSGTRTLGICLVLYWSGVVGSVAGRAEGRSWCLRVSGCDLAKENSVQTSLRSPWCSRVGVLQCRHVPIEGKAAGSCNFCVLCWVSVWTLTTGWCWRRG